MKIGILGTRGIPNAYGGFEQFVQFLAPALVKRGHEIFVYCSSLHPYQQAKWEGVQLIHCRDAENKLGTAGQFLYDFNCLTDAGKRQFDILLQLGYTSNAVWYFRWPRTVNILNMDGLEWKRTKYNSLVKQFLKWSEKKAAHNADELIADSPGIRDHLLEHYGKKAHYIPYGASIPERFDKEFLKEFLLEPYAYALVIARMEPENHIEEIIRGYLLSGKKEKIILVGNTSNKYGLSLKRRYENNQVTFTEGIYDLTKLNALRHFSGLYFHGHSVGGTNPSLLEAMACQSLIIAHDNPFNKAVLNQDASYFNNVENLSHAIKNIDRQPAGQWKENNLKKIRENYNWDSIIEAYESLFLKATSR